MTVLCLNAAVGWCPAYVILSSGLPVIREESALQSRRAATTGQRLPTIEAVVRLPR
jgi:hypothetical protein